MIRTFLLATMILSSFEAHATCFSRPSDPASTNRADWNDLVNLSLPAPEQGVVQFQRISDGTGPINLDYYSVTFRRHPSQSTTAFFQRLRRRFNVFVQGQNKENEFMPYGDDRGTGDPLARRNLALWESQNPKGAVMSFALATYPPILAAATARAALRRAYVVLEQGDVVATCTSDTDFVFSTVTTVRNDRHPVNGNRGFGLVDNGNGTWTFYTKGADRETKLYFGGLAARAMEFNLGRAKSLREALQDEETVYRLGHQFWLGFFEKMMDDLNQQGLAVQGFTQNSKRYTFP
jgi:hypothetical protein